MSHFTGNVICFKEIDSGFVMVHPYGITIAEGTKVGKNCTVLRGVF